MPEKSNRRASNVQVLKDRLQLEHLINRTDIFKTYPNEATLDAETVEHIKMRFKAYWSRWVQEDLADMFDQLEPKINPQ